MKASTPIFKILSVAVLVAVVLYFGVQLRGYLSDPMTTSPVYASAVEETIPVNGYLVRNEETFSSAAGTLSHELPEGAKVGVGQTLAVAYSDASALDTVEEIGTLELQLQQLQFALESYLDPDAALKLDSAIGENLLAVHREVSDGDYTMMGDNLLELKAGIMKRDYAYTDKEEIEANIAEAQQRLEEKRASISRVESISAPAAGTYSAICDGYETALTPDMLDGLTVSELGRIQPGPGGGNVGKLIYGDRWYYAAVIDQEDVPALEKRGQIELRFAKGPGMDLVMTIDRIGEPEKGQCVLVMYCDKYLAQTTMLRHQAAELILRSYEGLHIPPSALRVNEDGVSGVYCIAGVTARFKPVEVVYQGDGFVLVKPSDGTEGTTVLRIGDEVISTKGEMYDGKVVG